MLDGEGHQVPPGVVHVVPQGAEQEVLEGAREEEPLCKTEGMSEMQSVAGEVHDQKEEEQLQARSKAGMQDNLFQRLQEDPTEELQDEVQEQLQKGAELRDEVQHPLREGKADVRKANLWSAKRSVHSGALREVSLLKEVRQSALRTVQHEV